MVNVTIDGKTIEVVEGTTVLNAARSAGIEIPTLCDHPALTPYGGCRLCLVEVEGARTLQPSCTMPVSPNMIIHSDTQKVKDARKFVLTLIFSERNHFCPYCQVSGGDCELQNAAYHEDMTHWSLQPNWQPYPVDASHPYIILENNRCILCRRCVRACGELVGNFTLGFEERGARSLLVADLGIPLGSSSCISCGTCVQICPTGALIDRWSAYQGKDIQVEKTHTICTGCSVGCDLITETRDNRLVRIEGDWDSPLNGGVICKVGRFYPMDDQRDRVVTPLIRKEGVLKAATWEEALSVTASKILTASGKGSEGVAAMASTRLTAESLYIFKQLFKDQLKSEMITSIEEGKTTATVAAFAEKMGKPFEGTLEDLKTAGSIAVIGADLVEHHEVAGFFIKRAQPAGCKVVVLNSNPTGLDLMADLTIKLDKTTSADTLLGVTAAAIKLGLEKENQSWDAVKTLQSVISKTGLKEEEFLEAARILAASEKPVIIYGKGITCDAPDAMQALYDLANVVGAKLISIKGKANSLAASRLKLEQEFDWKSSQLLFLALADDEPSQHIQQRLDGAPEMIILASHISPLTAKAEVVLPVTMWLETAGHYLSLDGRLQEAKVSLEAPEGVKTTSAVLQELAKSLNCSLNNEWEKSLQARVAITVSA